uniref:Uncharacterized protein n=1 Tax=Lepeophtheirus salmonis TaxID=72036 RepID=A0A0K2U7Y6_LEPSM
MDFIVPLVISVFIRVSLTTDCQPINEIAKLHSELVYEFDNLPSVEESQRLAQKIFLNTSLIGTCVIVDGTHI